MSVESTSRPSTRPQALFLLLGTLWLAVVIGELVTGKILSRHGALIATRSDSPVTYWMFVLLFLVPTFLMYYIGTRRMGGSKRKKPIQPLETTRGK